MINQKLFGFLLPLLLISFFVHSKDFYIVQFGKAFDITALTVKVGDAIIFKNEDTVIHNVYSETPGFEFDFNRQLPGTQNKISFDHKGVVEVHCAIHPNMLLVITVLD